MQTAGKIQNLIGPEDLTRKTRLILTNAIYFKANWALPFQTNETTQKPFHPVGGHIVLAEMMNQTTLFATSTQEGARIISIPYGYNEASMIIILPDRVDGLPALEAELTATKLDRWLEAMEPTRVSLSLPKFQTGSTLDLKTSLIPLGIRDAFDPEKANLTSIADNANEPLYIGDVIHKAFISIDETGTEATAATAVMFGVAAGIEPTPPPPVPFIVDHPFLYLIRDDTSGAILFMGRITDPTK